MEYSKTLEKAMYWQRDLQLNKAVNCFYEILAEHPRDLDVIQRVFAIESRRKDSSGLNKICLHIFSQQSNLAEFQEILIAAYVEILSQLKQKPQVNKTQAYILLKHLARSHLQEDADWFANQIKKDYANDPQTADSLILYCEDLIHRKRFIKARAELKYLINFYGELPRIKSASNLLSHVEMGIVS